MDSPLFGVKTSRDMHDTGYSINSVSLNLLNMNIVYPILGIPFICIHADSNVCRSAWRNYFTQLISWYSALQLSIVGRDLYLFSFFINYFIIMSYL